MHTCILYSITTTVKVDFFEMIVCMHIPSLKTFKDEIYRMNAWIHLVTVHLSSRLSNHLLRHVSTPHLPADVTSTSSRPICRSGPQLSNEIGQDMTCIPPLPGILIRKICCGRVFSRKQPQTRCSAWLSIFYSMITIIQYLGRFGPVRAGGQSLNKPGIGCIRTFGIGRFEISSGDLDASHPDLDLVILRSRIGIPHRPFNLIPCKQAYE